MSLLVSGAAGLRIGAGSGGGVSKVLADLKTYKAADHAGQVIKVSDVAESPNTFTWAYSVSGTWKSVYLGTVISYDPIAPTALRVASLYNVVSNGSVSTGAETDGYIAMPFIVGNDQSTVSLGDYNFMKRSSAPATVFGSETIGNSYMILQAAIEMNGYSNPVYFSGARSYLVADGLAEIVSDDILASKFGFANGIIPAGTKGWIKFETRLPSTTAKIGITDKYMPIFNDANAGTGQGSVWQSISYNPANTSLSSIDAVGAVRTVTGTAGTVQNKWKNPVLLGRPVNANAPSNFFNGDSETAGYSDDLQPAIQGVGYSGGIQLTLTTAQKIPCLNFGAVGWLTLNSKPDDRVGAWLKYCKTATVMLGTNDFDAAGVNPTTVYNSLVSVVNEMKTRGAQKVAVLKVPPRTTGTYATEAAQTTHTNYLAGAAVDQHNALIDAAGFDLVIDLTSTRGTDTRKWYSGSGAPWTGDGIHGTRLMQRNRMGAEASTKLFSFFGIAA